MSLCIKSLNSPLYVQKDLERHAANIRLETLADKLGFPLVIRDDTRWCIWHTASDRLWLGVRVSCVWKERKWNRGEGQQSITTHPPNMWIESSAMKVMPVWMKTTKQTKPSDDCCHIRSLSNTHQTKPSADGCHTAHLSGSEAKTKWVTVSYCWVPSIFFYHTRSTPFIPLVQQRRHSLIPVAATFFVLG